MEVKKIGDLPVIMPVGTEHVLIEDEGSARRVAIGDLLKKLDFDPTKQGLPIWYMWGDTTGESKDSEVTLTYKFAGHTGTLTRKWQGSGSIDLGKALGAVLGDENKGKFNYTIKLDQAIEAKAGWGAHDKYCLKANVSDFSHARNLCALKIYGQACASRTHLPIDLYQCPNWGGVDGFPVLLIVNDAYYGLYTMNIPKDGWMLNMPTEGAVQEAIVCAEVGADFSGAVTLGDGGTYKVEYATDESDTDWIKESLDALMTAVAGQEIAEIETRLDIDSAIDYLLMAAKLTGGDALSRNYLLYTRDGVKWAFVPYDADTWFGISWGGDGHVEDDRLPTIYDCTTSNALMKYLVKYLPDRIAARYAELRDTVLSASNIVKTVLNFSSQIPKAVFDAEAIRWPGIKTTETNNAMQIADHIRAREPIIDEEIAQIDAPRLKPQATWYDADAAGAQMSTITDIVFDAAYEATGSEEASWDCSASGDGSIMAYRAGTAVYIKPAAHKYIRLSADSSYIFSNDGTYASFSALARIQGTQMLVADYGTSMAYMCAMGHKLTTPVCIPRGVTNVIGAFTQTWQLKTPPSIPDSVMYMSSMFVGGSLLTLPQLPNSLVEMHAAFTGCANATNIPRLIPGGVITVHNAFKECRNASGFMVVNAQNISNYTDAFYDAGTNSNGIVLAGACGLLAELAATNADGKVSVLA